MVTPFDSNGALDLDGVRRLAKWLQDNGNDGLVVGGTTGEASTLSDDEKLALFAAAAEAVWVAEVAEVWEAVPPAEVAALAAAPARARLANPQSTT